MGNTLMETETKYMTGEERRKLDGSVKEVTMMLSKQNNNIILYHFAR
jgi:hypothetical protein